MSLGELLETCRSRRIELWSEAAACAIAPPRAPSTPASPSACGPSARLCWNTWRAALAGAPNPTWPTSASR